MQIEGSSEILELRVLGDWAFIRNRIEMTVTPPSGNPFDDRDIRSPFCARRPMASGGSHAMQTF
jgi:hypothetical protein